MKLFRICATVGRAVDGRWRTEQVPAFVLEGDVLGILTERDAENYAERMLVELLRDVSAMASACAVEIR